MPLFALRLSRLTLRTEERARERQNSHPEERTMLEPGGRVNAKPKGEKCLPKITCVEPHVLLPQFFSRSLSLSLSRSSATFKGPIRVTFDSSLSQEFFT